jgi:hypothetical protein
MRMGGIGPGFLSLVQGSPHPKNVGLGLEKIGSCQPVVLAGRVGSNPTPGAITILSFVEFRGLSLSHIVALLSRHRGYRFEIRA